MPSPSPPLWRPELNAGRKGFKRPLPHSLKKRAHLRKYTSRLHLFPISLSPRRFNFWSLGTQKAQSFLLFTSLLTRSQNDSLFWKIFRKCSAFLGHLCKHIQNINMWLTLCYMCSQWLFHLICIAVFKMDIINHILQIRNEVLDILSGLPTANKCQSTGFEPVFPTPHLVLIPDIPLSNNI